MPKRDPNVGDATEWMKFALDDFTMAENPPKRLNNLSGPCFHAQQAAEKALKAVCIAKGVRFGITHDLDVLEKALEAQGVDTPEEVYKAVRLSVYATARYPSMDDEPPSAEDLREAVDLARGVLRWAVMTIGLDQAPDTRKLFPPPSDSTSKAQEADKEIGDHSEGPSL